MVIEGKQSLDFEDRSDLYNDSGNKSESSRSGSRGKNSGASRCGYKVSRELTGQAAYRQQKSKKQKSKQTDPNFIH